MCSDAAAQYEVGILFVHGIGEPVLGQTLVDYADPISDFVRRWLSGTRYAKRSPYAGGLCALRGARLTPAPSEEEPAHVDLSLVALQKQGGGDPVPIESRARERRFGAVEDIGIRQVGEGQEKDSKVGEEAVREMKAYSLMPPELEDKEIVSYVQKLADRIAANSDLKIPVKVTVLDSDEINAFALP